MPHSHGDAVLVLGSSWTLLRDSVAIPLEAKPRGLDAEAIGRAMIDVDGVREVHDLHVWTRVELGTAEARRTPL